MGSLLDAALKSIQKKFGETVVKKGVVNIDSEGIIPLGSPTADYALYGGVPVGRITEFSGAEGSGKTTTAILCAAQYQRLEKEENPDNPRAIIFLDNEGTLDPLWCKTLGYDCSEDAEVPTYIIRPEGQSAEEVFDMALDMLKSGEVGLLIFDSIATLVPQQIADESMEKQQMGGIAKALTRFANTAVGLLRKYRATLIGINQLRENLTSYGNPIMTPGGRAWRHACSSRLMFKRGEFFDEDGNILKTSAESPAGNMVDICVLKTKTCRWDRKLSSYSLNYRKGVDILADTISMAVHFNLIDNSTQGIFKIVNPETGELMTDEDGNEIKIRGKKNLKPYFEEHKDLWKRLYDICYDKIKDKEPNNYKSFEEMLGIDMNEKVGFDLNAQED